VLKAHLEKRSEPGSRASRQSSGVLKAHLEKRSEPGSRVWRRSSGVLKAHLEKRSELGRRVWRRSSGVLKGPFREALRAREARLAALERRAQAVPARAREERAEP